MALIPIVKRPTRMAAEQAVQVRRLILGVFIVILFVAMFLIRSSSNENDVAIRAVGSGSGVNPFSRSARAISVLA